MKAIIKKTNKTFTSFFAIDSFNELVLLNLSCILYKYI